MIGAIDDILFHVRRIGPVLRMLLVGVIGFIAAEFLYGSRGPDTGVVQFILYGLVGFVPATLSSWLAHKYAEEPQPAHSTARSARKRRRRDATCVRHLRYHLMAMSNDDIFTPQSLALAARPFPAARERAARSSIRTGAKSRTETPQSVGSQGFRFDFGTQPPIRSAISPASSGWRGSRRWRNCSTSPSSCPAPISATASTA